MKITRARRLKITVMKTIVTIAPAPILTKACPIAHGRIMPPMPPPTKNQPAMVPVTCIVSSERVRNVGKMEAMKTPSKILPTQRIVNESLKSRIKPRLARQPAKSA